MTCSYMWHDSVICNYTHSYVTLLLHTWHDFFSYAIWLIHMLHGSFMWTWLLHMWHDPFIYEMTHPCVTWLIHTWHDSSTCDTTHSYVTCLSHVPHDSLIFDMIHSHVRWSIHITATHCNTLQHTVTHCNTLQHVTWLILMWKTDSYATWLIHTWHCASTWDMAHPHVTYFIHMWHDSFICEMTHSYVTWLIHMWHDCRIRDFFSHVRSPLPPLRSHTHTLPRCRRSALMATTFSSTWPKKKRTKNQMNSVIPICVRCSQAQVHAQGRR